MKSFRQFFFALCAIMALAAAAEQPDPVISSIQNAYRQAKASINNDKSKGNELVATFTYTIRGKGKTTETLHFFYTTVEGTYAMSNDPEPHFFYYPLYFVTRQYNIGKQKYYEEYLYGSEGHRLLFALTQDYDENGKRFDRRYYFNNGSVYKLIGPAATSLQEQDVVYQAEEMRRAFDNLIRNPKE